MFGASGGCSINAVMQRQSGGKDLHVSNGHRHRHSRPAVIALPGGLPALIERAGDRAARRFVEFFTATIRNANTREAYARAVASFLPWCEERGLTTSRPSSRSSSPPTSRQLQARLATHGQAAPGRHPHALRLAGHRPGRADSTRPPRSAAPSTSSRRARRRCSDQRRPATSSTRIDTDDHHRPCATGP